MIAQGVRHPFGMGRSKGAPLGDSRQLPPPRTFTEGWMIGKPDLVFEIPEAYHVPAQGVVPYLYKRVKTDFKEDMWVQAAEGVRGDRSVVHHIIVYLIDPKAPPGPGGRPRVTHFTGDAPAQCALDLRRGDRQANPGSALTSPSRFTTQPSARSRPTALRWGSFLPKPSPRARRSRSVSPTRISSSRPIATTWRRVHRGSCRNGPALKHVSSPASPRQGLQIHGHQTGLTAQGSCSRCRLMISVGKTYYVFSEPIPLPKGTRIDCLAHFDKPANNPYNPDPSKLVRFGEQTFDEMLIGYCDMDVAVGDPVPSRSQFESNIENAMLGLGRTRGRTLFGAAERRERLRPLAAGPVEGSISLRAPLWGGEKLGLRPGLNPPFHLAIHCFVLRRSGRRVGRGQVVSAGYL